MPGMWQAAVSRLRTSEQQSPHFRSSINLDLGRPLASRQGINCEVPGVRISVNDLLAKACALALVVVLDVNAQFDETTQSIRRFMDVDISIAVVLSDGLITSTVRSANRESTSGIPAEVHALATRIKTGTLKPEES